MPEIAHREPTPGTDVWAWPDDLHPVLKQVYTRRGLASPDELELALNRLRPVGEFDSVHSAIEVLLEHRNRRILIFGDFDADGATSTALMVRCLRDLGFTDVGFFIPDRFALGYGLTIEAVKQMAALEPSLIVTVDNGTTSIAGVDAARAQGIDVLITDHHLPGDALPAARAIVNPNLPGDSFGGKCLAGVGVAFYLLAALGRELGKPGAVARYTDLVALGTMADVVKLDHSNRILVNEGLKRIRAGHGVAGIRALCRVSRVAYQELQSTALAYQIAPRLNAAGRLDDMAIGVRCLLAQSEDDALALASTLDRLNRERRDIESKMRAEAFELLEADPDAGAGPLPAVLCLYREDWHEGVVGLVASKVKERAHRPAFAFARTADGSLKGSARSIGGFHVRDALAEVEAAHPGLIVKYGGHAMAAGLTLGAADFERFSRAICAIGEQRLSAEDLQGTILTDGELDPAYLTFETAALLRDAGPWGQGFPEPTFVGAFIVEAQRLVGGAHLKLELRERSADIALSAIAFNRGDFACACGDAVDLVYRLAIDDYGARPKVQLIIEHLWLSTSSGHAG